MTQNLCCSVPDVMLHHPVSLHTHNRCDQVNDNHCGDLKIYFPNVPWMTQTRESNMGILLMFTMYNHTEPFIRMYLAQQHPTLRWTYTRYVNQSEVFDNTQLKHIVETDGGETTFPE